MDHAYHGRQRRKVLGDVTNRDTSAWRLQAEKSGIEDTATSSPNRLPLNESLVPNGSLAVRHPPHASPENKRLSAVKDETRPHNPKRDSEISNASTNASSTGGRRKTHIGPWQLGKTIGRGGCSRVRVVRHSVTGEYGAAKIVSKAMAEKVRAVSLANLIESAATDPSLAGSDSKLIPFGLEREICIMKLLDHPNIVRLHDIWENSNELYLIMEYVEGGDLFQYIGEQQTLKEIEVVHFFRQIIAALLYCHRLNIHHRDLKPENILLDRTTFQIKLVDFGMAALQPVGSKLTTPCGSPHYAAPEVIKTVSYDGGKADIWSCGVILYVMLAGTPPFNYSGDVADIGHLFRVIARAEYVMPDTLSSEAQDLIRRILVPQPKRRISIEAIWDHPFLHKYDADLGFEGETATKEHWVGPTPAITEWKPLTKSTVDREIFRYLRTLWHSEKEEVLLQKLLSKEGNQEKYFYSALVKYRNDQLEDYSPGPHAMAYSNSDHHHHVKRPPASRDLLEMPENPHKRTKSAYSILNDEHVYSKHSFYEPPPSDASYDPFRASRDALVPGHVIGNANTVNMNVTIHRGSDSGSRKLRPATALGHRTGSSLRIKALRNNSNRQSSVYSRDSSRRSNHSTPSQKSTAARQRSVSRSSLASSHWPSSPPVIVRPGSLGKRGVSFSHLKRNSVVSANTSETGGPHYTPEQRKFLSSPRGSTGPSTVSSRHSTVRGTTPVRLAAKATGSPMVPRLRVRKPESPSKYIQTEARKVSTELEKVMDEAFNRSSIGSSIRTTTTARNKDVSEYDTPPTSFSNTRDSNFSALASPRNMELYKNRPLPPIPDETPNTFLHRKLAEAREEIARRFERDGDSTENYNNVLKELDRLLQPNVCGTKRASSAPTKASEHPSPLPVISEEGKPDGDEQYKSYVRRYNAIADTNRSHQGRRIVTDPLTTIRLVDNSPTPIAPLNIRKRSGASTTSRATNDGHSAPWPGAAPQQPVRPYQTVQNDLFSARAAEPLPSNPLPTSASDKKETALKKKKSSWFRRNPEEKERAPTSQLKPTTGRLQIHDAWQGLDDRMDKAPVSPLKSGPSLRKPPTARTASSEFPMRPTEVHRNDTIKERKSFLGLFGRKSKEEKNKGTMEIGCNLSASSILSGFDLSEEAPGSPVRAPELQTNWLSRFLHIRPANKVLCFQIGRGKARQDIVRLLRDWQRFGVRDVTFDRQTNVINARIDKNNHLKIKPVSLVIELFTVLEHGRRANLCLARFTQTKGAASSFRKVTDIVEDVFRARDMLVEDAAKRDAMVDILG